MTPLTRSEGYNRQTILLQTDDITTDIHYYYRQTLLLHLDIIRLLLQTYIITTDIITIGKHNYYRQT